MSATAAMEYHLLTSHRPGALATTPPDPRLVRDYVPMRPEVRPPPFKRYDRDAMPLPRQLPLTGVTALDALAGRVPARGSAPLDLGRLSSLLFHSAGVTRTMSTPAFGQVYFRAAGSAGNLHPLEVYVVAAGIDGLVDGVYHYEPLGHALTSIGALPDGVAGSAIAVTGVPWRTAWKYRERGYRHLWWDAGTLTAQLLAVADAFGLAARVLVGFDDDAVSRMVGARPPWEVALVLVPLVGAAPALTAPSSPAAASGDLGGTPMEFPLITRTHDAGGLTAPEVARWRSTEEAVPAEAVAPPDGVGDSLEDVIRRRGSTREFDPEVVAPQALLEWGLAAATRPLPADFVEPGTTLLSHRVLVHAVEGFEQGAYTWLGDAFRPVAIGDRRALGKRLCLGQDLGGDGCFTVFHCSDLDLLRFFGARGYRAMQFEAGVVEGRLHLAAYSLGFGATGLTFFDEEVAEAFSTGSLPMLVTAVGRPVNRPARSGTPGEPVALRRRR